MANAQDNGTQPSQGDQSSGLEEHMASFKDEIEALRQYVDDGPDGLSAEVPLERMSALIESGIQMCLKFQSQPSTSELFEEIRTLVRAQSAMHKEVADIMAATDTALHSLGPFETVAASKDDEVHAWVDSVADCGRDSQHQAPSPLPVRPDSATSNNVNVSNVTDCLGTQSLRRRMAAPGKRRSTSSTTR